MRLIEKHLPNDWKRHRDSERISTEAGPAVLTVFGFVWSGTTGRPKILVWLGPEGSSQLHVVLVLTSDGCIVSESLWNESLTSLQAALAPLESTPGWKIVPVRQDDRLDAREFLSSEAVRRLHAFAEAAAPMSLGPEDWSRWNQFVIQVHLDDAGVDYEALDNWLRQNRWEEKSSRDELLATLERQQSILADYSRRGVA